MKKMVLNLDLDLDEPRREVRSENLEIIPARAGVNIRDVHPAPLGRHHLDISRLPLLVNEEGEEGVLGPRAGYYDVIFYAEAGRVYGEGLRGFVLDAVESVDGPPLPLRRRGRGRDGGRDRDGPYDDLGAGVVADGPDYEQKEEDGPDRDGDRVYFSHPFLWEGEPP